MYLQSILEEYHQNLVSSELFAFWETELRLRQQVRDSIINPDLINISRTEELDFLYRSLYLIGRKNEFWQIIANNMQLMPVLQWVLDSPDYLISDFLKFLPWHIGSKQPDYKRLQFLVSMYQERFHDGFIAIVNALDLELCSQLLLRTANPNLRELIKIREEQLQQQRKEVYYGIKREGYKTPLYPTLYGDKIQLFMQSVDIIEACSVGHFSEPYGAERFNLILQSADLVYQCGMVEDSLALLLDVYEDYQEKNRLLRFFDDEKIYQQFSKLLRRNIPIFSLVSNVPDAYSLAIGIYNKHFPRVIPEPAPLQYLSVYESIAAGLTGYTENILLAILYKARQISKYRPEEVCLLAEDDINLGMSLERLNQLIEVFQQKITALPHEAFVTMELIRLMYVKGKIDMNNHHASALADGYLQLWRWVPSKVFINPLLEQITPLLDDGRRTEMERVLDYIGTYNEENLKNDLSTRSELFKKKGETIRREILMGKFMGVL